MPKVYLTEAQRQAAATEKAYRSVINGLYAFKQTNHITQAKLAKEYGIGTKRMAQVLDCDPNVEMSVYQFIRLLRCTGHKIVREDAI